MPATKIQHWSYSSLKTFETCAKQWYYSKVKKIPQPPNRYLTRGNEVHNQMESYLVGRIERPRVDTDLGFLTDLLHQLEGYEDLVVEEMWHYDLDWQWLGTEFTYESWLLAKMDAVSLDARHIVDWKTGRIYDDHAEQARLYALAAASRTFETEWKVDMVYIDQEQIITHEIDASDLAGAQDRWGKRAKQIFNALKDSQFPKTPSRGCKRCPYNATKGGPCDEG